MAIGLLAVIGTVPSLRVGLGQYFGAVVGVLGLGLVVGAWWGRARLLIALGLIVLPVALTAASGLADRVERLAGAGPQLILTLEAGIGDVLVETVGKGG